jgi:hypothetical protein
MAYDLNDAPVDQSRTIVDRAVEAVLAYNGVDALRGKPEFLVSRQFLGVITEDLLVLFNARADLASHTYCQLTGKPIAASEEAGGIADLFRKIAAELLEQNPRIKPVFSPEARLSLAR